MSSSHWPSPVVIDPPQLVSSPSALPQPPATSKATVWAPVTATAVVPAGAPAPAPSVAPAAPLAAPSVRSAALEPHAASAMMRMDTLVERRAMLVIRDMGPPATPASPARLAGDRVAHVPTLAARR